MRIGHFEGMVRWQARRKRVGGKAVMGKSPGRGY
jgi:hypothetical protein